MADQKIKLHWFLVKAKPRILYSIIAGLIVFFSLQGYQSSTRFLMGWSAASVTYLILVFLMVQETEYTVIPILTT